MNPTRASQPPSHGQLRECRRLGITVLGGTTSEMVSKLIEHKRGAVATELFKKSGIRPGSVVRKPDTSDERLRVMARVSIQTIHARRLDDGMVESFLLCLYPEGESPKLNMVEVCAPPAGWTHIYAVRYEQAGATAAEIAGLRRRFTRFMQQNLSPDDRQALEYGEYWRIDAVDHLRGRFLEKNDL